MPLLYTCARIVFALPACAMLCSRGMVRGQGTASAAGVAWCAASSDDRVAFGGWHAACTHMRGQNGACVQARAADSAVQHIVMAGPAKLQHGACGSRCPCVRVRGMFGPLRSEGCARMRIAALRGTGDLKCGSAGSWGLARCVVQRCVQPRAVQTEGRQRRGAKAGRGAFSQALVFARMRSGRWGRPPPRGARARVRGIAWPRIHSTATDGAYVHDEGARQTLLLGGKLPRPVARGTWELYSAAPAAPRPPRARAAAVVVVAVSAPRSF